eukprot:1154081-Pelagomonas_calceolata.AAC.3
MGNSIAVNGVRTGQGLIKSAVQTTLTAPHSSGEHSVLLAISEYLSYICNSAPGPTCMFLIVSGTVISWARVQHVQCHHSLSIVSFKPHGKCCVPGVLASFAVCKLCKLKCNRAPALCLHHCTSSTLRSICGRLGPCVRPDQSSATVRCHYLTDGTVNFAFTMRRAEYFIPAGILLKCFLEVRERVCLLLLAI